MKLVFVALLIVGIVTALLPLSPFLRIVAGLLVAVLAVIGLLLEQRSSAGVE